VKYEALRVLRNKIYFTINDVSEILGIETNSARVLCSRYTKKGLMVRLKREFYILKEKWEILSTEEFFRISNILQVPSYISLMSALSYYEVTTQVQRDFYESVCLKRSKSYIKDGREFYFYKVNPGFYFDFEKVDDFFIAKKEKAFVDAIYLFSLGRYKFDTSFIDTGKIDMKRVKKIIEIYPEKTKKLFQKYGEFSQIGKF